MGRRRLKMIGDVAIDLSVGLSCIGCSRSGPAAVSTICCFICFHIVSVYVAISFVVVFAVTAVNVGVA